jgi:hypothetical protein
MKMNITQNSGALNSTIDKCFKEHGLLSKTNDFSALNNKLTPVCDQVMCKSIPNEDICRIYSPTNRTWSIQNCLVKN